MNLHDTLSGYGPAGADSARRGESLHLRGDADGALRLLRAAARERPADPVPALVLARIFRDASDPDSEREWLEAALRADSECPAALARLGEMLPGAAGGEHGARLAAQEPWDDGYRAAAAERASVSAAPAGRVVYRSETAETPRVPGRSEVVRERPPAFAFPVREEEEEPEIEQNSAPRVATVTLAEIYFQQGLREQAALIYRQLLERQPGDASVRRRLEEIEASGGVSEG